MWLRTLLFIGALAATASATYLATPMVNPEIRIAFCFVASSLLCIALLIYQHRFASFTCRGCGRKMDKYRDPNTSKFIFYYACNECRIYWKNNASANAG